MQNGMSALPPKSGHQYVIPTVHGVCTTMTAGGPQRVRRGPCKEFNRSRAASSGTPPRTARLLSRRSSGRRTLSTVVRGAGRASRPPHEFEAVNYATTYAQYRPSRLRSAWPRNGHVIANICTHYTRRKHGTACRSCGPRGLYRIAGHSGVQPAN